MKKHFLLYFLFGTLVLTNCTNNKLSTKLNLNCTSQVSSEELKNCKEPNGHFEINLPKHFKREFFISENESRLYFADTTKELSETVITDIGIYFEKKNIDNDFFQNRTKSLKKNNPESTVIAEEINFQDKQGYIFYFNSKEKNFPKNSVEIFLQNQNNTYYLISMDAYGEQNKEERFCKALHIIEKSYFY